ncbi:hypothetical protein WBJ53_12425 [Spirosoma sp. SC4-14]|uniref:hypothetical protein n=1 Tax=Spirosoma sp. SC4-14 TaxID=3128900 RepID=UPI0030CF0B30
MPLIQTQDKSAAIQLPANYEKPINAVAPEQVNAALKKYIDYTKRAIIKAGDFEKAARFFVGSGSKN